VVGNASPEIMGVMRVLTRDGKAPLAYSLEVKREWESLVEYECPPRLEKKIIRRVREASLKAFQVLGCRDVSRIDFRITPEGEPYFLEVNPLPGLNSYSSDLPIMVRKLGISYQSLISSILDAAIARYPLCVPR
jgi:D-alanine-D-alanine ligase